MTQTFSLLGFVAKLKTIDLELNVLGPALIARACDSRRRSQARDWHL